MGTADLTDAAREAFEAFLYANGFETDEAVRLAALIADGLETLNPDEPGDADTAERLALAFRDIAS